MRRGTLRNALLWTALIAATGFSRADDELPVAKKQSPGKPALDKKFSASDDKPEKIENGQKEDDKKKEDQKKEDEKKTDDGKREDKPPDWYNVHGQTTIIPQGNLPFRSPYLGFNSLDPTRKYRATATATLYLAAQPWEGTTLVFNPEMAAGGGLGNPLQGTVGFGGFPNGEATRTGAPLPTPYFARAYWRQTIQLGGEQEKVEEGPNELGGMVDYNRIVIAIGKMSAGDDFDNNSYSHDPRTQFMNWGLMYNGAWDYPANVRGYTYGGTAEYNERWWTVRYGVFAEPEIANGARLDPHIARANGNSFEFEQRWKINDHPGQVILLGYFNNAHMGSYRTALLTARLQPNGIPDITASREYRTKTGFGLNFEQELTKDLGLFGRFAWNDGQTESWAFTEIDRTASLGLVLKGTRWSRPDDRFGVAFLLDGLSQAHRDYLAAGGVGFIVGDGRLNYGTEQIFETYYNFQLKKGAVVSVGYTGVNHPGYNRDRGPVSIGTIRLHYEF